MNEWSNETFRVFFNPRLRYIRIEGETKPGFVITTSQRNGDAEKSCRRGTRFFRGKDRKVPKSWIKSFDIGTKREGRIKEKE